MTGDPFVTTLLVVQSILLLLALALGLGAWRWIGARMREYEEQIAGDQHLAIGTTMPEILVQDVAGALHRRDPEKVALLVFVSPGCAQCADAVPMIERLAGEAAADQQVLLVSSASRRATRAWAESLRHAGLYSGVVPVGVGVDDPKAFAYGFNPRRVTPYFCVVETDGTLRNRGLLNGTEWQEFQGTIHGKSRSTLERAASPWLA